MGAGKKPPLDLAFTVVGTNILKTGDKTNTTDDVLELVYSGTETAVPSVTVTLVEIDEDEVIGQTKPGKNQTIAQFIGKIEAGAFTTQSEKLATAKLPETSPFIKVSIGGKTYDKVKLPGVDGENGLFELGVVVTAGKDTFRGTWRAYARHYTVRPAEGPILAFVSGAEDKAFFTAATKYWKQHADAVLIKDGMSLEEIVSFLVTHQKGFGNYGEINIVTHGNRLSAIMRIVNGGERELRLKTLHRALGIEGEESDDPASKAAQEANRAKFSHSADELGLGDKSRIVFRACNIGHRPDVLKAVRELVFADACPVFAPKFLQAYSDGDLITNKKVEPFEFFSEDLQFHIPGKKEPSRKPKKDPDGTSQEELMQPVFAQAHPSLTFDDEKASYTAKIRVTKPGDATMTLAGSEQTFFDFVTNAQRTDEQIAAEMQTGFDAERTEDMAFTRWDQWNVESISRKDKTQKVGKKVETVTTENIWVTVDNPKAVPTSSFVSAGAELVLGTDTDLSVASSADARPAGITLPPHKSVTDTHATISTTGAPSVEVVAEDGQSITFKGKAAGSFSGEVPVQFSVGPYLVKLRAERERLATATLSRVLVGWRRPLRDDDASIPYGDKRTLVIPDVNKGEHYGSSEDPQPSEDDLAKLFE